MNDATKLQWNSGGWFGGQLGSTTWILVAALLTGLQDLRSGLLLLGIFLAPNLLGLAMWRRRERLPCYPAMQGMILLAGLAGLLAVFVLEKRALWEAIQHGGVVPAGTAYLMICVMVIGLQIMFHFRFGRQRD